MEKLVVESLAHSASRYMNAECGRIGISTESIETKERNDGFLSELFNIQLPNNVVDFEITQNCIKCGANLPLSNFYASEKSSFGVIASCKSCFLEIKRIKNTKNRVLPLPHDARCIKCEKTLPSLNFILRPLNKNGLNTTCKACTQKFNKAVDWRNNIRKNGHCAECGYNKDYRVLEFAHLVRDQKAVTRTGKTVNISNMRSIDRMECEFKLCRNCHRLSTQKENEIIAAVAVIQPNSTVRRQRGIKKKQLVLDEKKKRKACIDCNVMVTNENGCMFDFDHIKPNEKLNGVSDLACNNAKDELIQNVN